MRSDNDQNTSNTSTNGTIGNQQSNSAQPNSNHVRIEMQSLPPAYSSIPSANGVITGGAVIATNNGNQVGSGQRGQQIVTAMPSLPAYDASGSTVIRFTGNLNEPPPAYPGTESEPFSQPTAAIPLYDIRIAADDNHPPQITTASSTHSHSGHSEERRDAFLKCYTEELKPCCKCVSWTLVLAISVFVLVGEIFFQTS